MRSFQPFFARSLTTLLTFAITASCTADEEVDYLTVIKPVLKQRCYACHGALKQESGLRLDTVELMFKGGESGAVINRKSLSKSELLRRVTAGEGERMPPEGEPLTSQQITLIRRWLEQGAPAPKEEAADQDPASHWAFQPVVRPKVPKLHSPVPLRNPIDSLHMAKLNAQGLTRQAEADKLILIRRLYVDLIGLPPTPADIDRLLNDTSDKWYEQLVDKLLNDPRYGERWGRHWMDIWRYSDWWGLGAQHRNSHKFIWHWRDWIIESLNNDLPYDEMVRLMLAADELHPADLDKLRATGFLARNYFLFNRNQWMEETVEHVSKGLLGLTFNCAKCHDHKYDPIKQVDFYRMRAIFEPYHVRTDMHPGELDLMKDGIPRVYDGWLDKPTYLYIRGQEKNPDKSAIIKAGVPEVFKFAQMNVQTVKLPDSAWLPGRQDWVGKAKLKQVDDSLNSERARTIGLTSDLTSAEAALKKLPKLADKKAKQTKSKKELEPLVDDNFATLDKDRWSLHGGGKWEHKPGGLSQTNPGEVRGILRWKGTPPQDFDASLRFTITGGDKWRSIGIAFDETQKDPSKPLMSGDNGTTVYASGYKPGPKVQGAFHRGSKMSYPPSAMVTYPIKEGKVHTLRVQVKGQTVIGSIDGKPVINWQTPLKRVKGAIQFTTFSGTVTFHSIKIAPLGPEFKSPKSYFTKAQLRSPKTKTVAELAVKVANAELVANAAKIKALEAERNNILRRIAFFALPKKLGPSSPDKLVERRQMELQALQAQRDLEVARAEENVATTNLILLNPPKDKAAGAKTAFEMAKVALQNARTKRDKPVKKDARVSEFTAAKWVPTRFDSSARDDKNVPFHATSTGRRLALAKWITDTRNPLTARVAVNHIWARHIGQPLVPTMFDFGRNGTRPKNQELLDWLATEFVAKGWSMKQLHRTILNSAVYQMSSSNQGHESNSKRDPDNEYLWRRPSVRIESQVVRDSILRHAGSLEFKLGGPSVSAQQQADSKRRSLYFFHSNNSRNLFLTTFDEALVKECYRREQSIVPQQALALSNSKLVLSSAPKIAEQFDRVSKDDSDFVRRAFAVLLGIEVNSAELEASVEALKSWRALKQTPIQAKSNLIWSLINHNDFVTLR